MPTAFRPWLPPLCRPRLHHRHRPRHPQSRTAICQPPPVAIKGAPLPISSTFPPPPLRHHCAIMPPSLSHHEMLPRPPSELPDTAPSFAPMLGAPSTPLPAPSATPLLHHHCSPPLGLRHRGTPRFGEPSPLFGHQTGLSPR
jgi:hypothetical protein